MRELEELEAREFWSSWYCDNPQCDGEPHGEWTERHARVAQRPPAGDWFVWMLMSGRGFGKSRAGSEWIAHQARSNPRSEWAVVAPTWNDVRKCAQDPGAGLVHTLGDSLASFNSSIGTFKLHNGAIIHLASADKPDRLRGYNLWGAWCDELSSWRYDDTWHLGLIPAIRIGEKPRVVVTTTPKPVPLVKLLAERKDGSVVLTAGSTWDNAKNLAPTALEELRKRYEGTRAGRQELFGELLLDVPGALWTIDIIDAARRNNAPVDLVRVVVAVDPAVTAGDDADETGIIVCALDELGHGWVLADLSCRDSPNGVAQTVVNAYHSYHADKIVAEVNNGGDYIGALVKSVDADVAYGVVRASRGKWLRAEPVAAAYEQGRVHHLGVFAELETQMCSMTPGVDLAHDDRLDACVYGLTELGLIGAGVTWEQVYQPFDGKKVEEREERNPWLDPVLA